MSLYRVYRRLVLQNQPALWLAVAGATFAAAVGMTRLSFEDDPQNLYRQENKDFAVLDQLHDEFGAFDDEILIVIRSEQLFSDEGISALRQLVERIRGIKGVGGVFSMLDARRMGSPLVPLIPYPGATAARYARAKHDALRHPLVAGNLLSQDGHTALVIVQLEGNWPTIHAMQPIVAAIRRAVREVTGHSDLRVSLSGMPIIRLESLAAIQREQLKFTILALCTATIISWILFRQLAALAVAITAPLVGTFWALGLMGWMGIHINGFNMLLPTLVLVLGVTDSLHLVVDLRRGLAEGQSRKAASVAALDHLTTACFLTSLTTAIGFGSLLVSQTVSIREFGLVCAMGAVISFLAVISLTPLMASSPLGQFLVGARDKRKRRAGHAAQITPRQLAFVLRFPRTRIVAAIIFVVVCAPLATKLTPDVRSTEAIPETSETIRTLHTCDEAFGGSLPVFFVLQWPRGTQFLSPQVLAALRDLHAIIERNKTLSKPFSILNTLQVLPGRRTIAEVERYLAHYPPELRQRLLRTDLRKLVVSSRVPDIGAAALRPTWEELERSLAEFEQRHVGFHVALTGRTVVAARNLRQVIGDLARSLAFAAVVIVAILTLVFRSFLVGLISILPNLLPLVANATLLVACNLPLQLTSVVTFSLCLGLAVDDTIHYLLRFQRERQAGWPVRDALLRTYYYVGYVLVATSAMLCGGFAVIALSAVPALRLFAALTCTAVLTALIGDLVVLPALLLCCPPRTPPAKFEMRERFYE